VAKKKGKITGGHTTTDDLRSKIKKGSQVLYITKADMSNPFYYSCCRYVVVDVFHKDISHLEPKGSAYRGSKVIEVIIHLWDGHSLTKTKHYDKLLDMTKQIPKSRHIKIPKKLQ
jgi:hypothetical protein